MKQKSIRKQARRLIDITYQNENITNFQELAKKAGAKTIEVITILKSYGDSYDWVKSILESNLKMKSIGPKSTYLGLYPCGSVKKFWEFGCARAVIKNNKFITYSDTAVYLEKGDILISLTRDRGVATYARIMEAVYPRDGIGILLQELLISDSERPKVSADIPMKKDIERFIRSYRAGYKK